MPKKKKKISLCKKTRNLLTRESCSLNMEILNLFYPLLNFRVNFEGKTSKISF